MVPLGIEAGLGVTAIETRVGGVTVSCALPLICPEAAVMLVEPTAKAVATPDDAIDATPAEDEVQVTPDNTCFELSVSVPVAVNCCVVPFAIEAALGPMAIEASTGAVTVSCAVALICPEDAVIVVVPRDTAVALPEAAIVATPVEDEVQVALESTCFELSVKIPVAVNCCAVPLGIDTGFGETTIDTRAGAATVKVVVALIDPEEAVITEEPCATVLARPAAEMVATPALAEVHKQELVTSFVVPSLKVPVDENCSIRPSEVEGFEGEMAREMRLTVGVFVDPPPHAVITTARSERQTKERERWLRKPKTRSGIFSHRLCCNWRST